MKSLILLLTIGLMSGCAISRLHEKRACISRQQHLEDELAMNPDKYTDIQVKEMIKQIHECKIQYWEYEQEEKRSEKDVYDFWH